MQQRKRPCILYVEDDHDLALLVKERLAQAGIAVELAADGEEAMLKFAQAPYDLLALDQALPGLDGLGVIRRIAAQGPLPPTVMVTGTGTERIAVETMKLGVDDYIIKDLDGGWLDLLPGVIDRVLAHRRLVEDKRAAEVALREKELQLWRAQKLESLGILAGGIAHDFNNILAGIMGYADLLKARLPPSEPAREDIDIIKKAVQRAADLTRQMLAYSGKGKLIAQPIDVSRIVTDTWKMLEVSVSKKSTLTSDLASNLPAIEADPAQVHQVILNLVINASEAMGEQSGVVAIRTCTVQLSEAQWAAVRTSDTAAAERYVCLEVADTGCGMNRETLARIFDPFFSTKFTGRGLGLAAVYGIVRGHKGGLRVTSEPDKGTTFQVYFPASTSAAAELAGETAMASWRGSGTILVVDDEEIVRNAAQRMIEHAGFSVLTARDGEEAIGVYRLHQSDIVGVILDLTMPKMNGEETLKELRIINSSVPVILSSGFREDTATERFSDLQLGGFIQKPYQLETLTRVLRKAVEYALAAPTIPSQSSRWHAGTRPNRAST